jgi:dihydrodipicolinate synthase/N-acetylneuraminate lyase
MLLKRGIYPVIHTPLLDDESIDFDGLNTCIEHYLETQIAGLTILGSGGELPYFSDNEQYLMVRMVSEKLQNKKTLIAGINAYSSHHALQKIKAYTPYIDSVLLLLNEYYQSTFEDYYHAISTIAHSASVPILLYYFPQVTGRYFSSDQLIKLLSINNIIGIKDSSMHLPTAKKILKNMPQTLYFSGLSLLLEKLVNKGAAGAICPIASILPAQVNAYFNAVSSADTYNIEQYSQSLKSILPIVNTLHIPATIQILALNLLSNSPIPLLKNVASSHANTKEALQILGLPIKSTVRKPLPGLANGASEKIARILKQLTYLD